MSEWSLDLPLLRLSESDIWTLKDACEGVQIIGGTGSGKTSGSGRAISDRFLKSGFGGLILTVKSEDRDDWIQWIEDAGRSEHLFIIEDGGEEKFNFLDYEMNRPKGGHTENIVTLLSHVIEIAAGKPIDGGNDPFWAQAAKQLLRNTIDLMRISGETLSIPAIYKVITSAPSTRELLKDKEWLNRSYCFQLLKRANQTAKENKALADDFEMTENYFLEEFLNYADKTQSSIIGMFTSSIDPFLRGTLRQLFCTETTCKPDITLKGGIILIDLNIKDYSHIGRVAQGLYKLMWQQMVERRNIKENDRPVFIWSDENQFFLNSFDISYQQTARSKRACSVYLTQNIANYHVALGVGDKGKAMASSILGNLSTKIFHANSDPDTNEWAANVFGKEWGFKMGVNTGSSENEGGASSSQGASMNQQLNNVIEPSEFTTLLKGGNENNFIVEGFIHQAGRTWNATNKNYLKTNFSQK